MLQFRFYKDIISHFTEPIYKAIYNALVPEYMWYFVQFHTLYTNKKDMKTPMEECYFK